MAGLYDMTAKKNKKKLGREHGVVLKAQNEGTSTKQIRKTPQQHISEPGSTDAGSHYGTKIAVQMFPRRLLLCH